MVFKQLVWGDLGIRVSKFLRAFSICCPVCERGLFLSINIKYKRLMGF